MSAHRGKADIPPQGRDFRCGPTADIGAGHSTGIAPQLADFLNVSVTSLGGSGPQVDLTWLKKIDLDQCDQIAIRLA